MSDPNDTQLLVESLGESVATSWRSVDRDVIERCLDHSAEYAALPDEERNEILLALIHLEIGIRRKRGQSPTSCEYARRFPGVGREAIEDLISLPAAPPIPVAVNHRSLANCKGETCDGQALTAFDEKTAGKK